MIARAPIDGQSTSEGRPPGAPVLVTLLLMRSVLIVLADVVTIAVIARLARCEETVAIAEKLLYRGWAQPRVQAITGCPASAVV